MKDLDQNIEDSRKAGGVSPHGMTTERGLVVLWGIYRGWTDVVAARRAHCSPLTARKSRVGFQEHPETIFYYGLLERRLRGKRPFFKCNVCRSNLTNITERKARDHVLLHFFTRENLALHPDWMDAL